MEFTKQEKQIIGDFVHSSEADTLIKSDGISLIDVLIKYELIHDEQFYKKRVYGNSAGLVDELRNRLFEKIPAEEGKEIMKEYYGG